MTDTSKPPNRPTFEKPTRPAARGGETPRGAGAPRDRPGSDRPRADRDAGPRDPGRRDGASKTRGAEPAPPKDDARIAKVMARAGLCSRRDAEGWIAAGRVAVNGAVIDSPALNVKPGDGITVDGQPLPEREVTRVYLFHKPRGLVTTARDPEGRPTIFDNLPEGLPRVVSVGRLDINTEGLMLLTNDGGLARVLELPATGWLRRYRVRANGAVDQAKLDGLKGGITLDGVDYAGIEATLDRVKGANAWLTMGLREGKNREIKRVLEALGLAVTRLIRISFGPFQLGELPEGAVEAVPTRVLRDQLGPKLAAQANVDFEPREEPAARRGTRAPEGEAPPRPSRSEAPPPRPHVSALRSARKDEAVGEGRRRIERGATADRRGRAVAVERVVPVEAGSERGESRGGQSRNARRFAAERGEYVAGRQKTRAEAGGARRGTFGERPAAGPARGRRDDEARPVRGGDRPRAERAGGFGGAPRGERTGGDERPRGFGPRPGSGKPNGRPGGFGSERPATGRNKAQGGAGRGERSADGARPGGFGADRPAGGRGRPPGGEGRPGGGRPVGGGRPRGGKPPSGRP